MRLPVTLRCTLLVLVALAGCMSAGASAPGDPSNGTPPADRSGLQPGAPCGGPERDPPCNTAAGFVCLADSAPATCGCPAAEDFDFSSGSCRPAKLGDRPGHACGPSGEGTLPYAPCNANRGLRCTPPNPAEIDSPPTCRCPPGQSFSPQKHTCVGARTGERAGDACGESSPCNAQRGLACTPLGSQCACIAPAVWSSARLQCLRDETDGCTVVVGDRRRP